MHVAYLDYKKLAIFSLKGIFKVLIDSIYSNFPERQCVHKIFMYIKYKKHIHS
jgi:hypothetical protein